jgi:hypothetical protein
MYLVIILIGNYFIPHLVVFTNVTSSLLQRLQLHELATTHNTPTNWTLSVSIVLLSSSVSVPHLATVIHLVPRGPRVPRELINHHHIEAGLPRNFRNILLLPSRWRRSLYLKSWFRIWKIYDLIVALTLRVNTRVMCPFRFSSSLTFQCMVSVGAGSLNAV